MKTSIILLIFISFILAGCEEKASVSRLPDLESSGSSESSSSTSSTSTEAVSSNSPALSSVQGRSPVLGERFIADAAAKLEIEVDSLLDALGTPPDIEAAAEKLKIPVEDLSAALRPTGGGAFFGGAAGGGIAALLEETAEKLEVSVEKLVEALGRPFDIEAAAEKLDLTVEALTEALPEQITSRFGAGNQTGRQGAGSR